MPPFAGQKKPIRPPATPPNTSPPTGKSDERPLASPRDTVLAMSELKESKAAELSGNGAIAVGLSSLLSTSTKTLPAVHFSASPRVGDVDTPPPAVRERYSPLPDS